MTQIKPSVENLSQAEKETPPSATTGSDNTEQNANSSKATIPKTKLFALSRFKSMSNNFHARSQSKGFFPPSSWDLSNSESPGGSSGASERSNDTEKYKKELEQWKKDMKAPVSTAEVQTESAGNFINGQASSSGQDKGKMKASASEGGSEGETVLEDAPEPQTLAMKIKTLIDEKFTFGATSPSRKNSQSAPTTPGPNSSGSSNSVFSDIDAKFAQLLSSEAIMNGSVGKGIEKGRESVWAMLDKLGYRGKDKGKGKAREQELESEEDGIMICTPLQLDGGQDLPEIAESDIVIEDTRNTTASTSTQTDDPSSDASTPAPTPKTKTTRVFYPSPTKISLQVTWWGYRLYLPPPIMAQLSSAHVAAAKRGAMLTAALKWVLDQVPIMMVPPQFQPGMMMLRRVSPYLGYVGAFIAWSWEKVQRSDTGNGVVLTATWLLPIAILPSAWDFEVHGKPKEASGSIEIEEKVTADELNLSASTSKVDMAVQTDSPPPIKREGSKIGSLFPVKSKKSRSSNSKTKDAPS
ncbi:hypothetical protein K435DRAFT_773211 [Dendrothele bispora CBS 962.96]|uniref:Uncharacterized protein n=1 Tax=Dendrothele bispora (strain CBS 962.96) TaxID=1314807 RepID=A0A4S8MUZ4_DENBC|nr:hypothetical protein K435DRAFT_773211 [Dendrothele bispora CBS 962.96]